MAWTASNAPDTGANTLPPTATAMTATKAKTATGRTMPKRRIRPRLRLLLRAPVRCRDKAVLSSGRACEMAGRRFGGIPAFRPRALAVITPRRRSAAPDLVRRLARRAQVPLADNDARKTPKRAGLRQESPQRGYRNGRDDDPKTITLFVTNADQRVIEWARQNVMCVSFRVATRRSWRAPRRAAGGAHGADAVAD